MFGERVRLVRRASNLTQEAFAGRLGLKQNSVALIESGKRNASDQVVLAICREFGIREEWLRTGEGPMKAETARAREMADSVSRLFADESETFRAALIGALLRFDPDGPEWSVLERIYRSVASEMPRG